MSINNFQAILFQKLTTTYKDSFLLAKLDELKLEKDTIVIKTSSSIDMAILPKIIIDATGFHSVLMNKTLGIPFLDEYDYGSALKITWPEHQLKNKNLKETEFHDCHESTEYYNKGFSSVSEFSYPIPNANDFFKKMWFLCKQENNQGSIFTI